MGIDTVKFTLELVKAIDEWQGGSIGKQKKARRLQRVSDHLGGAYRNCPTILYRQFRVNRAIVMPMAVNERFVEAISSWTASLEVAKHFREWEVNREKVLMIYARTPYPEHVILNLSDIYADPDFMATVEHHQQTANLKWISEYGPSQCEVILDEIDMRNEDVAFIGAYRNLNDVVPMLGERSGEAESDAAIMRKLTTVSPDEIFWAPSKSAASALRRYAERAKALLDMLPSRKIWDEADTALVSCQPPLP